MGADGTTRAEIDQWVAEGLRVVLLDVRTPEEFAAGSVPGARSAPADRLEAEVADLGKDGLVVAVCNHGGSRSQGAAQKLREWGFEARHLVGGVHGTRPVGDGGHG